MLKKTFTALAALGIAGTLSLAPTAPAQALGWCKDARHVQSDRCLRKAERKARWDAFWAGLFDKRHRGVVGKTHGWRKFDRRDRHVIRKDRGLRLFDKRDRGVVRDRGWRLGKRDTHAVRKDQRWRRYDRRDRRALK